MPLFFSDHERSQFEASRQDDSISCLVWALRERVARRAATPSLLDSETTVDWWHCAAEYLTDAAFVTASSPEPAIGDWLRLAALGIARADDQAWVGPSFRDHETQPLVGNLETAHLSWGLAVTLDLAPQVFTEGERLELAAALRDRAIPLCRRWLEKNTIVANWRCVLTAGLAVPAAVLNDRAAMAEAVRHYQIAAQAFQSDGSYGESLQYANYAGFHLMLAWEALVRRDPALADELPLLPHNRWVRWAACSHFYQKPLGGKWGCLDRPRAANFGDSAAIFRPTADVLLHVAARTADLEPQTAGVARWLFDELYLQRPRQGPWDRASFGFVNHFGFLTLPLLAKTEAPLAPAAAGLPELASFGNGDVLARDAWAGRTILAVRTGGSEPLACSGHLHGDLNSFILAHNRERLLVDGGHSCYRGLVHGIEIATGCHNTCTFSAAPAGFGLQEDRGGGVLQQHAPSRRLLDSTGQPQPAAPRATRQLLAARAGDVSAIASDAAAAYGPSLREFTRVWLLARSNVLFVVDFIVTTQPMRTTWHWLLNNRDDDLDLRLVRPDRLVMRRGAVGMKLFHFGPGRLANVAHGYVHDAYHPKPAQLGEGHSGSGTLVNFVEPSPATQRCAVHTFAFDTAGGVTNWHLRNGDGAVTLEDQSESWSLRADAVNHRITLKAGDGRGWTVCGDGDAKWALSGP